MRKIFTLFLLFLIVSLNAQNIKTSYKISFCGKPQKLTLIQYNDGTVLGFLETDFSKQAQMRKGTSTPIKIKTEITDAQTKRLFADLNDVGIESLVNCNTDKECKSVTFLDANDLIIDLLLEDGTEKRFDYLNIYPLSDTNTVEEETELRKKVQRIVTNVDEVIHLKEMFNNVSRDLEIGFYYCYLDDMSTNCIDKKNSN
ncbi:hypothetical protein [Chishuiella sp.]|uniref:hypothetical protein n=1 Tax=Chishuiella sp. TaxID=1969467 RepID=UPI0028A8E154|nr:hypothetical protein [Chishuiella sp.]